MKMAVEDAIAGLSPIDIQQKFALPNTPTHVTDVIIKLGTEIRARTANGLFGFDGGGQQYELIEFLDPSSFTN